MSEAPDDRLSELYQQSSHETPPAHLDRAILELARKSVRRRSFSPFGNPWVSGLAMAGVAVISVILVLTLPQQPSEYGLSELDTITSQDDEMAASKKESGQWLALPGDAVSEPVAREEAAATPRLLQKSGHPQSIRQDAAPAAEFRKNALPAPKQKLELLDTSPAMKAIVAEKASKTRVLKRSASVAGITTGLAAPGLTRKIYLQAGTFRDELHANKLQKMLVEQGYKCEIREVATAGAETDFRVYVGPFADAGALDNTRQQLQRSGIETEIVSEQDGQGAAVSGQD